MSAHCPLIIFLCFTCGLLTAGAMPVQDDAEVVNCPEGWAQSTSRCFKFFSNETNWMDAEKACIDIGGNLASVHSSEEHTFIINLIKQHTGGSPPTWLGGHDAVQEGSWLWSDGSKFDYTHWRAGEPNNEGAGEHCLVANYEDRWHDAPCIWFLNHVCSRDASKTA